MYVMLQELYIYIIQELLVRESDKGGDDQNHKRKPKKPRKNAVIH